MENMLVDHAGNIKLCDFGMTTQLAEVQEVCGTLIYMAPEILAGKNHDNLAGDLWSLGILLYVQVTGYFPYVQTTAQAVYRLISHTKLAISCQYPLIPSLPNYYSPPRHRITIREVLERRWRHHKKEHVEPQSKEILPRIKETMKTINYTCEEVSLSLTPRKP